MPDKTELVAQVLKIADEPSTTLLDAEYLRQAATSLEQSAAREGAMKAILALWVKYDDTAEDEFVGLGPVFLYEEAITATRAALAGEGTP